MAAGAKATAKKRTTKQLSVRRFEFRDDKSEKLWEISARASTIELRWGRIDSRGQGKVKKLASSKAAQAEVSKLIADKVRKGYVETTHTTTAPAKKARKTTRKSKPKPKPLREVIADLRRLPKRATIFSIEPFSSYSPAIAIVNDDPEKDAEDLPEAEAWDFCWKSTSHLTPRKRS